MNDRIHRYLDGELPYEALTPDERVEAAALEDGLAELSAALRAAPVPDLAGRVMAALPEPARPAPAPAWRRALAWAWSPRPVTLRLRPAYGLAAAGVAAALLAGLPPDAPTVSVPDGPPAVVAVSPEPAPPVYVQFRLDAGGAHSVALAGSFTGWQPSVTLEETEPGVWTALVPLHPGVHDYAFVVDGRRWVADPHAPQVDDSFGGTNSRISLPPVAA